MNRQRVLEIHRKLCADARMLLERKGEVYASEDDALSNFYQSANRLGISPLQAVLLHKDKQDIALAHIADGAEDTDGLHSRLMDIINYCVFALAVDLEEADRRVTSAHPLLWINRNVQDNPWIGKIVLVPACPLCGNEGSHLERVERETSVPDAPWVAHFWCFRCRKPFWEPLKDDQRVDKDDKPLDFKCNICEEAHGKTTYKVTGFLSREPMYLCKRCKDEMLHVVARLKQAKMGDNDQRVSVTPPAGFKCYKCGKPSSGLIGGGKPVCHDHFYAVHPLDEPIHPRGWEAK